MSAGASPAYSPACSLSCAAVLTGAEHAAFGQRRPPLALTRTEHLGLRLCSFAVCWLVFTSPACCCTSWGPDLTAKRLLLAAFRFLVWYRAGLQQFPALSTNRHAAVAAPYAMPGSVRRSWLGGAGKTFACQIPQTDLSLFSKLTAKVPEVVRTGELPGRQWWCHHSSLELQTASRSLSIFIPFLIIGLVVMPGADVIELMMMGGDPFHCRFHMLVLVICWLLV